MPLPARTRAAAARAATSPAWRARAAARAPSAAFAVFAAPSAALAALALLFAPAPARADDETQCRASYVAGQRRYKLEHDPLGGREQLLICARTCPDALRASCGRWLMEIEAELPSIVVKALDARGQDVLDASLEIDGKPVSGYVEGTPIEENPGEHTVVVTRPGLPPARESVLLHAGEKLRVVEVWTEPRAAARPVPAVTTTTRRPVPAASVALAGVGAALLASFGVFAIWTTVEYDQTNSCAPRCLPSTQDPSFEAKTIVADVSLGAGAAALVAAGIVFFARPTITEKTARARDAFPVSGGPGGLKVTF